MFALDNKILNKVAFILKMVEKHISSNVIQREVQILKSPWHQLIKTVMLIG